MEWVAYPFSQIFQTQESNQGFLHSWWILSQLSYQGRPTKKGGDKQQLSYQGRPTKKGGDKQQLTQWNS